MIKCLTFSVIAITIWIVLSTHFSMASCSTACFKKPSKSVKEIISEQNKLESEVRYSCSNFQKNISLASKKANQTLQNIILTATSLGADISGCMRTSEKAIKSLRQAYEKGIETCLTDYAFLPTPAPPQDDPEFNEPAVRNVQERIVKTKCGFVASRPSQISGKAFQPAKKHTKKFKKTAEKDFKACAKQVECKTLTDVETIYKREKICIANKINNIGVK